VPGQYSSGGKQRLGRITKAGDPYLRTLLILGARSVLTSAKNKGQCDESLGTPNPAATELLEGKQLQRNMTVCSFAVGKPCTAKLQRP